MKEKIENRSKAIDDDGFEDLGINPESALEELGEKDEDEFEDVKAIDEDKESALDSDTVYPAEINWNVDKGMQSSRLHKLFSLLFEPSAFYIGHDVTATTTHPLTGAYEFQTNKNNQKIYLFSPDSNYTAIYNINDKDRSGSLNDDLKKRLFEISQLCTTATQPTTYIIPLIEMPNDRSKGVPHQILLTISYDPISKKITPTIFDSIGRETAAEWISSKAQGKLRTTCDEVMSEQLQKHFKETGLSENLTELNRKAYNHQNRLTEGNCGSYTFRTIKEVISSTAKGIAVSIPGSGLVTSNSYLTSQHKQEIENCVKYRTLSREDIQSSITKGSPIPVDYSEFSAALAAYRQSREEKPEQSSFNWGGYSKKEKLKAAELLISILNKLNTQEKISESQYDSLQRSTACLMNSSLGDMVKFFLHQLGAESLEKLVSPHVEIEFELLDVPEISAEKLASNGLQEASRNMKDRLSQMTHSMPPQTEDLEPPEDPPTIKVR